MKIIKLKFLFALILFALSATACRTETTTNQNAPPIISATNSANVYATNNDNSANANNAAERSANQLIKPTPAVSTTPKTSASPTITPTISNTPKFKNYTANGVIKKIDAENSSVTIDHEDIGDYMVGMEMPFPVVDKNILKDLKVGDKVRFVLETGVGVERVVSIRKN